MKQEYRHQVYGDDLKRWNVRVSKMLQAVGWPKNRGLDFELTLWVTHSPIEYQNRTTADEERRESVWTSLRQQHFHLRPHL